MVRVMEDMATPKEVRLAAMAMKVRAISHIMTLRCDMPTVMANMLSAKQNMGSAKPNMGSANADMTGAKDNMTIWRGEMCEPRKYRKRGKWKTEPHSAYSPH